jgi:hypothetical protein
LESAYQHPTNASQLASALLKAGASSSIFVHGDLPDSFHCTLSRVKPNELLTVEAAIELDENLFQLISCATVKPVETQIEPITFSFSVGIEGVEIHSFVNGTYEVTGEYFNGAPLYENKTKTCIMFNYGAWRIGNPATYKRGLCWVQFSQSTDFQSGSLGTPELCKLYTVYDGSKWRENQTLKIFKVPSARGTIVEQFCVGDLVDFSSVAIERRRLLDPYPDSFEIGWLDSPVQSRVSHTAQELLPQSESAQSESSAIQSDHLDQATSPPPFSASFAVSALQLECPSMLSLQHFFPPSSWQSFPVRVRGYLIWSKPVVSARPFKKERTRPIHFRVDSFESRHNYRDDSNYTHKIHIPGADQLKISFDPKSCTEPNHDYVKFSNSDTKYSGKTFCGMGDVAAFKHRGESFEALFVSDNSKNDWGYRFNVRAKFSSQVKTSICQSQHPHLPHESVSHYFAFPGAKKLRVRFDPQSNLMSTKSSISFFKLSVFPKSQTGDAYTAQAFPGVGGLPELIIDDYFVEAKFNCDCNSSEIQWGYLFTVQPLYDRETFDGELWFRILNVLRYHSWEYSLIPSLDKVKNNVVDFEAFVAFTCQNSLMTDSKQPKQQSPNAFTADFDAIISSEELRKACIASLVDYLQSKGLKEEDKKTCAIFFDNIICCSEYAGCWSGDLRIPFHGYESIPCPRGMISSLFKDTPCMLKRGFVGGVKIDGEDESHVTVAVTVQNSVSSDGPGDLDTVFFGQHSPNIGPTAAVRYF